MNLSNIQLGAKLAAELRSIRERIKNAKDGSITLKVGFESWSASTNVGEAARKALLSELHEQEAGLVKELSLIGIYDDPKADFATGGASKCCSAFDDLTGEVMIPGFGAVPAAFVIELGGRGN